MEVHGMALDLDPNINLCLLIQATDEVYPNTDKENVFSANMTTPLDTRPISHYVSNAAATTPQAPVRTKESLPSSRVSNLASMSRMSLSLPRK